MQSSRHVLIYGASGALGKSIVNQFKNASWIVTSLDFSENNLAHYAIQLPKGGMPAKDAFGTIKEKLGDILKVQKEISGNGTLDAIINVAGGKHLWNGSYCYLDKPITILIIIFDIHTI